MTADYVSMHWLYGRLAKILSYLRLLFTPLALLFLVYIAWHARLTIASIFSKSDMEYLLLAILSLLVYHASVPLSTLNIFKAIRESKGYRMVAGIYINRLLTRYLPGGIWHTATRMADFHRAGIGRRYLVVTVALESFYGITMSFVMGGGVLIAYSVVHTSMAWFVKVAVMFSLVGLCAGPYAVRHWLLRKRYVFDVLPYCLGAASYIVSFFFLALSFVLYLKAIYMIDWGSKSIEAGGIFLFSAAMGLIAPLVPQGIGVLEGVAAGLLDFPMSIGEAIILIAGFRVIILSADVAAWVIFWFGSKLVCFLAS